MSSARSWCGSVSLCWCLLEPRGLLLVLAKHELDPNRGCPTDPGQPCRTVQVLTSEASQTRSGEEHEEQMNTEQGMRARTGLATVRQLWQSQDSARRMQALGAWGVHVSARAFHISHSRRSLCEDRGPRNGEL